MASLKQLLPLAIMYGSKQVIDFEDEENTPMLRLFFGGVTTLIFCVYGYLYLQIQSTKDETVLNCKKKDLEPAPFGAQTEGDDEDVSMTFQEYDMKELLKVVKQAAMQSVIVGFMHFKFEYKIPLVMTSVMSLVNLADNNLIKVYVLGNTDLTRPFPAAVNPLADFLNPPEEEDTDKKTEKKKEKKKDK